MTDADEEIRFSGRNIDGVALQGEKKCLCETCFIQSLLRNAARDRSDMFVLLAKINGKQSFLVARDDVFSGPSV